MENVNVPSIGMDIKNVGNIRHEMYEKKKKSDFWAYLLWIFGFHYLYLGRPLIQILFWFTGGGFLLWWMIDMFRVHGMVKDHNRDVALEVLIKSGI